MSEPADDLEERRRIHWAKVDALLDNPVTAQVLRAIARRHAKIDKARDEYEGCPCCFWDAHPHLGADVDRNERAFVMLRVHAKNRGLEVPWSDVGEVEI